MTYDPRDDRDVVVVDRGGSILGTILGVAVIALLVFGVWYFAFGPGQGTFGGATLPTDITLDLEQLSVAPDAS